MPARHANTARGKPRILALVFPALPIEVARRAAPELSGKKLALLERRGGSLHVSAASNEAQGEGVRPGSTHAHALAAAPGLLVREHRPEQDRAALLELARWAEAELAPRAALDHERRALLVDVSGTSLVHGSERRLLSRALAELRSRGHSALAAIADTPLAAVALAVSGSGEEIAKEGETRVARAPLPLGALGFEESVLEALAATGVRTVAQLLALPRKTLPSRFGNATLDRLDRALGERADPLSSASFEGEARERLELEGGTDRLEDLSLAIELLSRKLASRLAAGGRAARSLDLVFSREDAVPVSFSCRLAGAVSRAPALERVLKERLERLDLSAPVTAIELAAPETAKRSERQGDLFSSRKDQGEEELALLLARLEARLGARCVLRASLAPDHRPERAWASFPATSEKPARAGALPKGRRPTRLLARPTAISVSLTKKGVPASFTIRGKKREVSRATGPERIETGFWDGNEARRDYWILADEKGRESWVFQDLEDKRWFLHGSFD
ncbi:DNA polymerase Y family protein [bacterium]|nr:DNA polymerase Y family protein [bacterium]